MRSSSWAVALSVVLSLPAAAVSAPKPAPKDAPRGAKGSQKAHGKDAPKTFIAVPFARGAGVPGWLSVAAAESLYDALVQQPDATFISQKQLDSVLRRVDLTLDDPRVAEQARRFERALGATEELSGTLALSGDTYTIEARWTHVSDGAVVKKATATGTADDLAKVLNELARTLLDEKPAARTADTQALESVTRCALLLERQAIGPKARPTLTKERLDPVEGVCAGALTDDAQQGLAHAYMSIVHSLRGKFPEAHKDAAAAQAGRFVPMGALAEWFALRRAGDNAAAAKALEAVVQAHPGFLHALGYLGEEREEAGDDAGALVYWTRYLERSPGHPYATARAARAWARLGKKEEAVKLTQASAARDPGNVELQIELASRHLDAGHTAEAESILERAAAHIPPRPLAALRLGWLYFNQGKNGPAREQLERAAALATRQDESRTRAIAHSDLALLNGREDKPEAVVESLYAATRAGLRKLPCDAPELAKYKGQTDFDQACAAAPTGVGDESIDDEEVAPIEQ
ncbi:MAG: hypothetical protein JST92_21940 [Deltaproteobacteria bacterium]|nr:hypothetical protein [Deltaproteobacteria bacterium]